MEEREERENQVESRWDGARKVWKPWWTESQVERKGEEKLEI